MWLCVICQENSIIKSSREGHVIHCYEVVSSSLLLNWFPSSSLFCLPSFFPLLFAFLSFLLFVPSHACTCSFFFCPLVTAYSRSSRVSITAMLMGLSTGIWRFVRPQLLLPPCSVATLYHRWQHPERPSVSPHILHSLAFIFKDLFMELNWNCSIIWEKKHYKGSSSLLCQSPKSFEELI